MHNKHKRPTPKARRERSPYSRAFENFPDFHFENKRRISKFPVAPHHSVRGYVVFKIAYIRDAFIRIRNFLKNSLKTIDNRLCFLYICAVVSVFFACKQMRSI